MNSSQPGLQSKFKVTLCQWEEEQRPGAGGLDTEIPGAGKMAQLVKLLPHRPEDVTLISAIHTKAP